MLILAALLACSNPKPAPPADVPAAEPVEETPTDAPAGVPHADLPAERVPHPDLPVGQVPTADLPVEQADPCVEACLNDSMAVAMAWEAIEASCRESCAADQPVNSAADLALRSGQKVKAVGTLARVDFPEAGQGTALLLDDGTALVITHGEPPDGWQGLLGQRIRVLCTLWEGPPPGETGPALPHLSDCAGPLPENVHPL